MDQWKSKKCQSGHRFLRSELKLESEAALISNIMLYIYIYIHIIGGTRCTLVITGAVLSFQQVEIWLSFFILRCSTHGALKPLPCPKDFKTSRGQVRSTGPRSSSGVSLEKTAVHSCQPGRRHHELEAKLFSAPLRWWLARGHCGRNEGGAANGRAIGWTILMLEYVGIGTKNYHELSTSSNININMSICISYVFASTWEVGANTAATGLHSCQGLEESSHDLLHSS